jgi:probable HAF family extracellular repeat protein
MKGRKTSVVSGVIVYLILSSPAYGYRPIIDLGTLGGNSSEAPYINNNGQIVGNATNSYSTQRGCLFDPTGNGANTDLGPSGNPYSRSAATAINDKGQIVGLIVTSDLRACLFDNTGHGANKDLGTLGGSGSWANSINNNNKIVGWANDAAGNTRACLFDSTGGGNNTNLGSLGGTWSWAESINDKDQIVGGSYTYGNAGIFACLFDATGGPIINLGNLGNDGSYANSINNNGQIVGYAYNRSGDNRAVLFDPTGDGANKDLGTLAGYNDSFAEFINDNGQIVGEAMINDYSTYHAVLFDPTGQGHNLDLNTLIDPSLGWTLSFAYGINNNGWIVGKGINPDGYEHAFLLTPEPTTLLLLGLGGLASLRKTRK